MKLLRRRYLRKATGLSKKSFCEKGRRIFKALMATFFSKNCHLKSCHDVFKVFKEQNRQDLRSRFCNYYSTCLALTLFRGFGNTVISLLFNGKCVCNFGKAILLEQHISRSAFSVSEYLREFETKNCRKSNEMLLHKFYNVTFEPSCENCKVYLLKTRKMLCCEKVICKGFEKIMSRVDLNRRRQRHIWCHKEIFTQDKWPLL